MVFLFYKIKLPPSNTINECNTEYINSKSAIINSIIATTAQLKPAIVSWKLQLMLKMLIIC